MTTKSTTIALETATSVLVYGALNVGTLLLLNTIAQYATFDLQVGFLQAKQDYISNPLWLIAFYIHVFSSILTLLAGFIQFAPLVLTKCRRLHRFVGRVYFWDILLINFPSGLILAIYANGGIPSKIAFLLLDGLWFWFTLKAVLEIRKGNPQGHRDFMIRSYALTLSAVTLRTWKLVFQNFSDIDPSTVYMIDAWMGFVPNLLFAEWLIRRRKRPTGPQSNPECTGREGVVPFRADAL